MLLISPDDAISPIFLFLARCTSNLECLGISTTAPVCNFATGLCGNYIHALYKQNFLCSEIVLLNAKDNIPKPYHYVTVGCKTNQECVGNPLSPAGSAPVCNLATGACCKCIRESID